MADFGDFEHDFTTAPVQQSDGSGVAQLDGYSSFSAADNGVHAEHEDSVFASQQAFVYDAAAAIPMEDPYTPVEPVVTYRPSPILASEPEEDDPRIVWRRKNAEVLAKKDQEEAMAKSELLQKASEHLNKFYEARKATLQAKKDANREAESVQAAALPAGETPWERVTSVINFNFDAHAQDVSRYKSLLITCKTNNVPVRA